ELESEILQLRKALNEARLERDILKYAVAFFNISRSRRASFNALRSCRISDSSSATVRELESEILQLRKALNEARLERDILKYA
ncbi:hypothetical protein PSY73_23670, partial [Shigella flexneri]|nr:hypothetical protein [Shigella flexneri]